jgi:hypothetical protein
VDGHNRQPTVAEFEARTRELRALTQRSPGSCLASSGARLGSANPTPKR